MSLVESLGFLSTSNTLKTTKVSSSSYVISLAALPSRYAACLSAPSNTIDVYDSFTFQKLYSLPGHDKSSSTSLKSVPTIAGSSRPTLVSSGTDGSIKVWDERISSHSIKMTHLGNSRSLLSFDVSPNGLTVAAGTDLQGDDAFILYWDPRQPAAPLRTHSSTHSDDITAIMFFPQESNLILSASTDGLISLSNPEEDDEDKAVMHVGNWECSISQAAWIPNNCNGTASIWAASDMETFSTWSSELDIIHSQDIRSPSIHSGARTWVTDYLVTCNSSNSNAELGIFVGSNEGDIALLSAPSSFKLGSPRRDQEKESPWTMHKLWSNGHAGIVRCVLWDEENHVLLSGGEDSKINIWAGLDPSSSSLLSHSATAREQEGEREREEDAMDVDEDEIEHRSMSNGIPMNGVTPTSTFRRKRDREGEGEVEGEGERKRGGGRDREEDQGGKRARR